MEMNVLGSPCWYAALTLKERLAGLESAGGALPSVPAGASSTERLGEALDRMAKTKVLS